ncbi:MAG TPA: 16S rRNA (cytosine(967)-C(5))-methyltransferase RsmB [Clostridiales bacterium]|nr:16S rRNA (cytosine(967)-C(5))-methyltransferase RsmB [Clostridiales bacterium]
MAFSGSARELAFLSLLKCEKAQKFSNLEVDSTIRKHGLTGAERALYTNLVYGTIERKITLDYLIEKFSSIPFESIDPKVLTILRLGAYQLIYLDRIPPRAACSESVELCKLYSNRGAAGFVNAVLREISRRLDRLPLPDKDQEPYKYLSVLYSCPEWLCYMWDTMYGREKAQGILEAMNIHPYLTLRANSLRITRDELYRELQNEGIPCTPTRLSPHGVKLGVFVPIAELRWLSDGLCFVQDEASQLCVDELAPQPGELVIDTCACPGGKSFGCAIAMGNKGKVIAMDLHENKLSLVRRGAQNLGIDIIETIAHNGLSPHPGFFGAADKVICDAPCSGLGVIAKKPDLRFKKPEDLARLPELQLRLLSSAAEYVKPGGTLMYSTCTLSKAENEGVAQRFLETVRGFELDGIGMRTLFPHENGTDGFFMAKFKRVR